MNEAATEIDQALEIARKIREKILFENTELEKQLHGFLTVAQSLGRTDDIVWAKSELIGYKEEIPLPDYRQGITAQIRTNEILMHTKDNSKFFAVELFSGVSK